MCNACGFGCCAWDGFSGCGCDHCSNPECWSDGCDLCGEVDCICGDDNDFYDDEPDERDEMVFDCGLEDCLMPGEHFRHECHTAEMLEAMYEEHERAQVQVQHSEKQP